MAVLTQLTRASDLARVPVLCHTAVMKRVLIFSLAYFPRPVGGAEIALKEITDRIGDIEFHLVTHRFDTTLPTEEKIGNVFVYRLGAGNSYSAKILFIPRAALRGLQLHRALRFDGMWAMMTYMLFPIVLMRFFGNRTPYLVTLQEGDPFKHVFQRWFILPLRPLLRYGFRRARTVQAISNFLAEWTRQAGFAGESLVIPNAVDTAHFTEEIPPYALENVRVELGKKMGDVLLITTSRLVKKNALDQVIRALTLLPQNVRFVILGEGAEEASLKKLGADLKLKERVLFLGYVAHNDMPKYLKAADIFIRPSRSEGMGNSFVEAMAAGLPVIATQVGGIADFLFDEKRNPGMPVTGWAVDVDSPESIAQAVREVMEKPEKVRAVVATAKAMVTEKYTWDGVAGRMRSEVFDRLSAK